MITSEIRLDVHVLTVRERGTKNAGINLDLDNFLPGSNILPLFQDFINSFDKFTVNENSKRSIQCTEKIKYNSKERYVSGIIHSGDYGIEGQITDKRGKAKAVKNTDDFDVKPFYFLLWIPPGSTIGFLVTQHIGKYGVSSLLKNMFKKFFQDRFPKNIVQFSVYLSKETAQQFVENGGIREILLKRMGMPADIADRFGLNLSVDDIESVEFKITAKRNTYFQIQDKAKKVIENSNTRLFTMDELPKIGMDGEHHELVKIKLGGQQRTIDLSNVGEVKPYFDVDSMITRHPSGHPVFESVNKIALDLIKDIEKEIFGT